MPTQTVNGATMSYVESGSGFPLVLVHGFPLSARMWDEQVAALSQSHRVIAPDLRGFGKSPSSDPFTTESLADDVHALLERVGALPCALAGLSMGGYVALAYVKKYPTDLRGLVLIDTRAEADSQEGKQNRQKMIELVRHSGSTAVAEQMLPKLLCERTLREAPQVVRDLRQIMQSTPALTIEHALAALRDRPDHTTHLPSIGIPTLILVGGQDVLTPPECSKKMHDLIPRSRLHEIPDAGHMTPMEQPGIVIEQMKSFLAGLK